MECSLECLLVEKCAHRETWLWSTNGGRRRVTIDMLPDVALLEIFDFYLDEAQEHDYGEHWNRTRAWHTLVHVCRKWRATVFGSPRRLDLRLLCRDTTPVKETLAVWPPLPIVIYHSIWQSMDNIFAALEHNNRVCEIDLSFCADSPSPSEEVLAAIQKPFPALTDLVIKWWYGGDRGLEREVEDEVDETPVVPESFLGGSAPRLKHVTLEHVPFPGLPKLLLSAAGLVSLRLYDIPHSGYISPEAMVRCLSTLTRLETLSLEFESPLSRPVRERRRLHPPTRSILLALTEFCFQGVSEYLEDLVARIDAPLLASLYITFFHQLIFDTPQLAQFVARSPYTQPPAKAHIVFSDRAVAVRCPWTPSRSLWLGISCRQSDWQLSSLAQVCSSSFPEAFILTVEHLYFYEDKFLGPHWQGDIEDSQWLEVLHPFTAVKYLYLSQEFASRIAPALQELAGEVLPSLQNIFLEGFNPSEPVPGAIGKFVSARQLTGHPIAVSHWEKPDMW